MTTVASPGAGGVGGKVRSRSRSPSTPSRPIPSPPNAEEIHFNDANGNDGFALRPEAVYFKVHPSGESQMNDSSPFHFTTVVDYQWDAHYTYGRLIATHLLSKFIAYVVKVGNAGAVRVIDMNSKERVLMKGDKGLIKDVDFVHKPDEIIIGFIDEFGTFYVNKITQNNDGKLTSNPIIKVSMDGSNVRLDSRRFIWCKFVPDELKEVASPKDSAFHFAVLQHDVIYAGNLMQLVQKQGEGTHDFHEVREEFLTIDTHSNTVTDASFAPDGTALATASKDGTVKFFQIYFHEKGPARCLYSWAPHDGRKIDKILFLDNHTIKQPPAESQYWKFMITASENMTELKLFTCRTWDCLQTLKFCTPAQSQWKVEIDLTAQYLVATDIHRKAMYMVHLEFDDDHARFDWVREFSMPWNVIGFNISAASALKLATIIDRGFAPSIAGNQSLYDQAEDLNLLEINVVQPRSLQQGSVAVKSPENFSRSNGHHRISFNNDVAIKDIKASAPEETSPGEGEDEDEDPEPEELQNIVEPQNLSSTKSTLSLSSSPRANRSGSLEPERSAPSPSLNNWNNKRKSSSSVSPHHGSSGTIQAQLSEKLSSLMGLSSSGLGLGQTPSRSSSTSTGRAKSGSPHQMIPIAAIDLEKALEEQSTHTNGLNKTSTSSSSSPSREVEEILSPKNTVNFIVGGLSSVTGMGVPSPVVMNADIDINPYENGNIPAVLQVDKVERKSPFQVEKLPSTALDSPQIPQLLDKVNSLVDMMTAQANEMKDLKKEVSRLRITNETSKQGDVSVISQIMENSSKQNQLQMKRLEEVLKNIDTSERKIAAAAAKNEIPTNIAECLAATIGNVVKTEIETVVPHTLDRMFEPARLNVNTQIERLTSIVEAKLTQNISQIFQREKIWQNLTTNFQNITKNVFDTTFNDIFVNSVFPRCQSAVQEMLTQVNDTFMKGTKEYLSGLEGVLERERKREDFQELIRHQINSMQDTLSSTLQVEVETQMMRVINGVQGGIVRQIEDSMTRELARAFKDQQRYFEISVIPRTVTPAVSVSESLGCVGGSDPAMVQRTLLALAKNGDLYNAFVQASNHGDVNVLLHLCKNFDPATVFACKLPPHVHVSIMHLLALDILDDTETKIHYLNVGLGTLDVSDRKTLKSVSRMIPVFQAAVSNFTERNPDSKLISRIKLLEMAFHGISLQLKSPSTPSQPLSQHSFSQYQ